MTMKSTLTLFFGITALLFVSCEKPVEAPKPIDMDKLKVEIQKLEDAFAAAEKAKDAAAVAAYYSEDAISYSRNAEPVSGRGNIQKQIEEGIAKDTTGTHNVYKVVDLFAEGNTAVEIGSWTKMNPAGEVIKTGHYMSYFQKRDGKYVCVRDMNVSSTPEPAAPAMPMEE